MEAIILAGGQGTRLKEVVPDIPKPMAPIHGHPFLEYQLNYWITQGVHRFVFSVGYKAEQILEYFGDHFGTAEICYAVERRPLGTGGGIRLAATLLKSESACLVLNGDTYFTADLNALNVFHRTRRSELTMGLLPVTETKRCDSVELDDAKRVKKFCTDRQKPGDKLINGGVYLANPELLHEIPRAAKPVSFENEILTQWVSDERRIFGYETETSFIDIGVPADYRRASEMLKPTILTIRRLRNAS